MGRRVGDPTMVSRCACQRQLKPPGGTTRSNVGVLESWWTCSCYVLPNSGPRRRILGLGKRGAASKMVARPSGEKYAALSSGNLVASGQALRQDGVHRPLTYRGSLGARRPGGNPPPPTVRKNRAHIVGPLSWLWCHRPPQVPGGCPTRCPLHPCPHQYQYPRRSRSPRPDPDVAVVGGPGG